MKMPNHMFTPEEVKTLLGIVPIEDRKHVREYLEYARDKILDPDSWHQGSFCALSNGEECSFDHPGREKFCALGAVEESYRHYVCDEVSQEDYIKIHRMAVDTLDVVSVKYGKMKGTSTNITQIVNFNDHGSTSHTDIMAVFNIAITFLGSKEEESYGSE